jgi:hypothetical protein
MNSASDWRIRGTVTAATLFIATAAFTLWQNSRVAILWDLSYLLDSSYRISLGQLPYKDFPFAHAPLTFVLHAAIIRLFGRVYFPHIAVAALEAGLATLLSWSILLKLRVPHGLPEPSEGISSPHHETDTAWVLATLLAAPLIFLGIYAIYPHPIYDSDCILAVLLALYLLQRADSSRTLNALAGAFCILPLFVKQNIGLAFLLVTLLAVAAIAILRRLQLNSIAPQLWFFATAAATLAAALILIHETAGLHNYFYWTVSFAAQRRLPGLILILTTYHQASLLWTIPAAIAALILLRRRKGPLAPSISQSHRDVGGMRRRALALLLLAAPFLWTIVSLALNNEADSDDRADQLLSLWPHLLILSAILTVYELRPSNLRSQTLGPRPALNTLLPLILLATIHGAFLSQQLWGSTYAIWPLLTLLIGVLVSQAPTIAGPLTAVIAATFLLCGGLYATSLERLSYVHLDGPESHAALPELRGLTTPGPWVLFFEELVRDTNAEIPASDGILLLPGEDPFYFTTGRIPQFPVLLFDPATNPYSPEQVRNQARASNIRWLIVTRNLQLNASPDPDLPETLRILQQDFAPYRTLTNYDIYRRKQPPPPTP